MSTLTWKPIPGFLRYSASYDGQIRRDVQMQNAKPGLVTQRVDSHGYLSVNLSGDDGKQRKMQVHTLIASAFLGARPPGLFVCHGPAGRMVNSVNNVRYDTPAANTADSRREGTMLIGSRSPSSKLDEAAVSAIHARCRSGEKQADVARDFGVSQSTVANIMRRRAWASMGLPHGPSRAIPMDRLAEAAKAVRAGSSLRAAANGIGVSPPGLKAALKKHPQHADLFEFRTAKAVKTQREHTHA